MRLLAASAVVSALVAVQSSVTPHPGRAEEPPTVRTRYVDATFQGLTAEQWAHRNTANVKAKRRFHRMLAFRPDVYEALQLAAIVYGVSQARVVWIATCESGHPGAAPSPRAKNPTSSAAGFGQFLASTWASTPFGRFSVFSPFANALAIAWEVKRGGSYVHWSASATCWGPRS